MFGEGGSDELFGGRGRDSLSGGAGDDEIEGEEAADTLEGAAAMISSTSMRGHFSRTRPSERVMSSLISNVPGSPVAT